MAIKAVLFDLDGTLVDSAHDLTHALNHLLAELGLGTLSVEEVKGMIGDGVGMLVERGLAARGGDPAEAPALVPRFLEVYEGKAARFTRPYPGSEQMLLALSERGLPLAVVTNKPYAASCEILEALDLMSFFAAVVGGDSRPERKPHPAPLLWAAERLRVSPAKAVMVGDNHHDVSAARAAGMAAVAVTWGYSHVPHEELGADRLISTFDELLQFLEQS